MTFGPQKINIQDIALNSLGTLIAGFIGSILILIIVFATSSIISIPGTFETARLDGGSNNPMFPFILSFITFIATSVTLFLSTILLHMINGDRYKKSNVIYGQLGFFGILTYLLITPIYIYTGLLNYDNIMIVFILHSIILSFGSSLLLEILNNYRYVLTGFYGSFVALFITTILVIFLFNLLENGYAKLLSLLILLPLINFSLTFFKGIFEMMYYHYYKITNLDGLGDIFYQIEQEEEEELREQEAKNNL